MAVLDSPYVNVTNFKTMILATGKKHYASSWRHPSGGSGFSRRVSHVYPWSRYILRHNGAGADDDIVADRYGQYGGVGTDTNIIADIGRPPKFGSLPRRPAVPEEIVHEHHPVGDEAIIADAHQFANEAVRLDSTALPNDNVPLDFNEWTDETVVADGAAVKIYGTPDGHVLPESNVYNANVVIFNHSLLHLFYVIVTYDPDSIKRARTSTTRLICPSAISG